MRLWLRVRDGLFVVFLNNFESPYRPLGGKAIHDV